MKIGYQEAGRLPLGDQQTNKNSNIVLKKVMIMAGGTGGHVMPALAVAQYLQAKGVQIHWLGTRAGIEARLVPESGIPISYVEIQGLRGKSWLSWALAPWRITKALIQSYCILVRERPQAVLSMGGYVAGPGAIVAWILGIPLILHEQNAILGWTNRLLAKMAKRIMVAFPDVFERGCRGQSSRGKVIHTGNPIRKDILEVPPPEVRYSELLQSQPNAEKTSGRIRVLILGGSQGATILNEIVPQALALLPLEKRPQVWHQTGKDRLAQTQKNYAELGLEANITDFIGNMAKAYAWADVVVCRSGALTVAELSAVGVASILIPFPFAVDDHQTFNAKYLSDQQGAFLLPQSALTANSLHHLILELIDHPEKRFAVAKACRQMAKPYATAAVAEHCLEVSSGY